MTPLHIIAGGEDTRIVQVKTETADSGEPRATSLQHTGACWDASHATFGKTTHRLEQFSLHPEEDWDVEVSNKERQKCLDLL